MAHLRPLPTSDQQIFSLTQFTQHFFYVGQGLFDAGPASPIAPKSVGLPHIHFTNSSGKLEVGQDSDRN